MHVENPLQYAIVKSQVQLWSQVYFAFACSGGASAFPVTRLSDFVCWAASSKGNVWVLCPSRWQTRR